MKYRITVHFSVKSMKKSCFSLLLGGDKIIIFDGDSKNFLVVLEIGWKHVLETNREF